MTTYEYGIAMAGVDDLSYPHQHRTGMTQAEAGNFINEWLQDGGIEGVFRIVRRPVLEWEEVA